MATVVLAAAGGAIGASVGGAVLGVSSAVIGKAVGATVGAWLDQRLFGEGSAPVEVGRRDQLRLTGSREGAAMARVWGRMRLGGQIIWSSGFVEDVRTRGGGKGTGAAPSTKEYSYTVSLAIALCEGSIARVARVWADGQIVDLSTLDMRVYRGDEAQLPDPLIAASVPEGEAPAFRGTAYVVIENLALGLYGNRIPQFSFEVVRRPEGAQDDPIDQIRAVALVPGTGEYALATEPVSFAIGKGETRIVNVNNHEGRPDAQVAIDNLVAEAPGCAAASLVVSWFGTDLRCGSCEILPKVEQTDLDGGGMPWTVSGLDRSGAPPVSRIDGRPGFGGTPADASVLQAIDALKAAGQSVMFYPFVLMDIRAGNGLTDPWTGAGDQPEVPWRGRITCSVAPGRAGSPDTTAAAATEVADFFGMAQPEDFSLVDGAVVYSGPDEWSYRRFILHYAHLCAASGGVDAFCIGSELRSLTQLRDAPDAFPAVRALRTLAADVRAVLGTDVKIGYAADWSEYFGHHPADGSGDVWYHLDPLWSDPQIDFIGIDNYMPLSDWRDGTDHADADAGSIYELGYLMGNIEGGEGYDWYYPSSAAREAQLRAQIEDGAYDEPWTFRYKDIRNWWSRFHWNRVGGVKQAAPTDWQPEGKPIWFTELGCPAIDKGTNQPNVFVDPLSSENAIPHYSDGGQDRYIQQRYLQAMHLYWNDVSINPRSRVYEGPMVDMSHAFVWAWDARPWPDFPQRMDVWSDGRNFALGHWISGRTHLVGLGETVKEICERGGLADVDVSGLHGVLAGYHVEATETARESLQPLMLAYGFDAFEREGRLVFRNRGGAAVCSLNRDQLAVPGNDGPLVEVTRSPEAEMPARVRISFVHPEKDYQTVTAEAQMPGAEALYSAGSDLPVAMSHAEANAVAARWLAETQVARDHVTFSLPRSMTDVGAGDIVLLPTGGGTGRFRVDRVEEAVGRTVQAVRVEDGIYRRIPFIPELIVGGGPNDRGAPHVEVMDLPLLTGEEIPHAPWVAAAQVPWSGPLAMATAAQDYDYRPQPSLVRSSVVGTTLSPLPAAQPGRWAEQSVDIALSEGPLLSRPQQDVLNGANVAALRGAGHADWEVIQFREAELIAERTYRLSGLLRGQAGTDGVMPLTTAAGADFVLLDGSAEQLELPLDALGLERHLRVGPAGRPFDDPSYRHLVFSPAGAGLRPYTPVHATARRGGAGAIDLRWVRRTRTGGDNWAIADVPLGEVSERYQVRVLSGSALLRETEVGAAFWTYTAAMQAADGAPADLEFRIAQISDTYGPGLQARIYFNE
ncbi:host specificity protein [Rhodobacteraceae bacterium 2CG4]|uniref:Host specificity protein n=1 Tax=Halovulum marinum TaxID=2662447 RepID=A0A6L5YYQ5_9RHOB|nr:glycoside hydrolase/phage tail family protein [Halovulum marinum]MSU89012.1 host specificity protein [Halovulum marinum]